MKIKIKIKKKLFCLHYTPGEGGLLKLLSDFNPLSANITIWSNILKQFVGNFLTNCLSVFDHFMRLALKGLRRAITNITRSMVKV